MRYELVGNVNGQVQRLGAGSDDLQEAIDYCREVGSGRTNYENVSSVWVVDNEATRDSVVFEF